MKSLVPTAESHDGLKQRVEGLPAPLRTPLAYSWLLVHGQWPEPLAGAVDRWRTRGPVTYGEKKLYRMARDRRPILNTYCDKVRAREFAAARIPAECLIPQLAVVARGGGIPWTTLPRQYVVKVNHASGGIIVVSERADPSTELPAAADDIGWVRFLVHPDRADPARIVALCDHWLARGYGWGPRRFLEWGYRDVPRRVVVEQFLDVGHGLPVEVKAYCFDGNPRSFAFVGRDDGFHEVQQGRYFDDEQEQVAARAGMSEQQWARLVEMSAALSQESDMLRVDWFVTAEGNPVFNELTPYPGGAKRTVDGHATLSPAQADAILSSYWQVRPHYR